MHSITSKLTRAFLFCLLSFSSFLLQSQELVRTLKHPHTVYWVDISDDGKHIYTAGKDTVGRVWNMKGKEQVQLIGHESSISSILYIDKEKLIVTGAYDNTAAIWDRKGRLKHRLSGHTDGVINLAVSEQDKLICTVSRDKTAKLWDFKGQLITTLTGHTKQVNYSLFLPEKKQIITGSFDRKINFWDYEGNLIKSFSPPNDSGIRVLALSPDGSKIYAGHRDGTISYSALAGKLIGTTKAHEKMVSQILFSENGQIITSAMEPDIKIWTSDFKPVTSWKAHDSYTSGIALHGNTLISSSGDQTVKIWKLNLKD